MSRDRLEFLSFKMAVLKVVNCFKLRASWGSSALLIPGGALAPATYKGLKSDPWAQSVKIKVVPKITLCLNCLNPRASGALN